MNPQAQISQSVREHGPKDALTAVTVGAVSTTAQDLSAFKHKYVKFDVVSADIHIVFGTATVAAADANDSVLYQNESYKFYIDPNNTFYRAIRAAGAAVDGTVTVAVVGE